GVLPSQTGARSRSEYGIIAWLSGSGDPPDIGAVARFAMPATRRSPGAPLHARPAAPLLRLPDVLREECLQPPVELDRVLLRVEAVPLALHRHPERRVAGLFQRPPHRIGLPERRALVLLAVGQEHRHVDVGGMCQRRVRQQLAVVAADDALDVGAAAEAA